MAIIASGDCLFDSPGLDHIVHGGAVGIPWFVYPLSKTQVALERHAGQSGRITR